MGPGSRSLTLACPGRQRICVPDSTVKQLRRQCERSGEGGHDFAFSRRVPPESCVMRAPQIQRAQGMPGVWRTRSRACSVESTRVSHHRSPKHSGIPCAMVLRLIRALPGVPGLIASVTREIVHGLDPSVGRSGPRDFAVRVDAARLPAPTRPSHPAPTSVTIAIRPSDRVRNAEKLRLICASDKAKYFWIWGWTRRANHC
jgi:hypothetical protein